MNEVAIIILLSIAVAAVVYLCRIHSRLSEIREEARVIRRWYEDQRGISE